MSDSIGLLRACVAEPPRGRSGSPRARIDAHPCIGARALGSSAPGMHRWAWVAGVGEPIGAAQGGAWEPARA